MKKVWTLVVLMLLITLLALPFGSSQLMKETGAVWAAPGGPGQSQPKPQPLNGSVIQAKMDKVTINIGAANGVKPGMIFLVKRASGPNPNIAEIKAEMIQPNSTNCKVVKWLSPDHRINPNDRAEKK